MFCKLDTFHLLLNRKYCPCHQKTPPCHTLSQAYMTLHEALPCLKKSHLVQKGMFRVNVWCLTQVWYQSTQLSLQLLLLPSWHRLPLAVARVGFHGNFGQTRKTPWSKLQTATISWWQTVQKSGWHYGDISIISIKQISLVEKSMGHLWQQFFSSPSFRIPFIERIHFDSDPSPAVPFWHWWMTPYSSIVKALTSLVFSETRNKRLSPKNPTN